ncbi:MAG: DEAD/DEAH box helicase [Bacteroidales bacterium]|nr:DEAD/DEAH box helicase [Bacteroidales bacterium]
MSSFDFSALKPEIHEAIKEMGFENPTPIQALTIPFILEQSRDLLAFAQTGTGKTAAFGLPMLQQAQPGNKIPEGLVLCPTRELCIQIAKDLSNYSKNIPGIHIVPVYGGESIERQMVHLRRGATFVVGTPGRTLDLINRSRLDISKIKWLVLDEADEMLNMGFKEELDSILETAPAERRTMLLSATMPREVLAIAKNYMHDPEEISAGKKNSGTENVNHFFCMVHAPDRFEALKRIIDINPNLYSIVFCRTRTETKEVADHLMQEGYNADALHGDLSQAQRDYVMNRFRLRHLQVLVATDVAARGLDVTDLTHIINYNLPDDREVYIHRTGRTGRAGKTGVAISIIHSREMERIRTLEKLTGRTITYMPVPDGRTICEKQLFNLVDKMENTQVNEEEIESFLPVIMKKLSWMDRDELIKKFISMEFNRFLDYYRDASNINAQIPRKYDSKGKDQPKGTFEIKKKRDRGGQGVAFSRIFLNVGLKNNINPKALISLINETLRDRSIEIGRIDLDRKFSFFEIDSRFASRLVGALNEASYNGMKLQAGFATD